MLPMGDAGQDDLLEIGKDPFHGLTVRGRLHWELLRDIPGLKRRAHRVPADILEIFGDPVHAPISPLPEFFAVHAFLLDRHIGLILTQKPFMQKNCKILVFYGEKPFFFTHLKEFFK